jgi:hypothetical protein
VTDERWTVLQDLEPALLRAFSNAGVVRIEYVSAFPQDDAWVWLGTATDTERDALAASQHVLEQVQLIVERHGFTAEKVSGVTVQSEETVNRDFNGSWFYALR